MSQKRGAGQSEPGDAAKSNRATRLTSKRTFADVCDLCNENPCSPKFAKRQQQQERVLGVVKPFCAVFVGGRSIVASVPTNRM